MGWNPPTGRRAWTSDEGAEMLAFFQASGLSASAFARRHGIGAHRVKYWAEQTSKSTRSKFVPVKLVDGRESMPMQVEQLELKLLSGRSLIVHGRFDERTLARWLVVLEQSSC